MDTLSVFGVSNELIGSYIERPNVDGELKRAVQLKKQIVVYGSSKQGKTALITKQLKRDDIITIECSPDTNLIDIYKSVLRQSKIEIDFSRTSETSKEVEAHIGLKANVKIPLIADGGAAGDIAASGAERQTKEYRMVEYNLALAQDISEILLAHNFNKYIILENFHYLSEDMQEKFSFDLRTFQDVNIRFVILGIWRERNRLAQFNGDLQDRIVEVAVEPWTDEDFQKVIEKGSALLNVNFQKVLPEITKSSFDSIGVFQELCKECCFAAGVYQTSPKVVEITAEHLKAAEKRKFLDYSGRHTRSFEAFVEPSRKDRAGTIPLFIPYYFIKVLLQTDFDKLVSGMKRKEIHAQIQKIHHRKEVNPSIMSAFLFQLIKYQIKRKIMPPLFDYDKNNYTMKIIDSTLYFFLRHCNAAQILEDLPLPSDKLERYEAAEDLLITGEDSPPDNGKPLDSV